MSACAHEDFAADVAVARIADDGTGENIIHFMAEITILCTQCGEPFGFRGPPAGHSWDEPRCHVTALQIVLPLMSPAELALARPLPALGRGPMRYEVYPRKGDS